ncbi:MAG: PTS sugar transporter subunit IIB [Endomicrobium sp.]|jgi:PTS system mannose-specific IIB component|nr:PTS sugar transporter subunit IIB [Endomicrobium sp.]
MPVILVRIDDRLMHGQIVEGWLKIIDVDVVLIASDAVAQDETQKILMAMTVPNNVKLVIKNLDEAANVIISGRYNEEKIMVLTISPSDVLYMLDNGADFKSVNVGGMHFTNGKRQLLYNIYVDDLDLENLYKIHRKGIEIDGRVFPRDEKTNIMRLIEREYLAVYKSVDTNK